MSWRPAPVSQKILRAQDREFAILRTEEIKKRVELTDH